MYIIYIYIIIVYIIIIYYNFAPSLPSTFAHFFCCCSRWQCGFVALFHSQSQDIYDVNALDLKKLGKSFGFSEPPHVPLDLTGTKRKKVKMDKAHKRFARRSPRSFCLGW